VLWVSVTPALLFTGDQISLPDYTGGVAGDRHVLLTAIIGGNAVVRALVKYTDTPTAGTAVTVEKWSVVQ
jgi:hypothetical protein